MNQVLLSFDPQDSERVAELVHGLEQDGFSVCVRDSYEDDAERGQVAGQVDTTACVVAVWTERSAGDDAVTVREEAARALQRGVLVPVLLDDVLPPLGDGEVQAFDLRRWQGGRGEPPYQRLVAAIQAKLPSELPSTTEDTRKRLQRRMRRIAGGIAGSAALVCSVIGLNVLGIQKQLCSLPLVQPGLSDACGSLGLGDRPTRQERLAWESRAPGCDGLRAHIERFRDGAYRAMAGDLLRAARTETETRWDPVEQRLPLYEGHGDVSGLDERAAKADALRRAREEARRLCENFDTPGRIYRFRAAELEAEHHGWDCVHYAEGVRCALRGKAMCALLARREIKHERCPTSTTPPH